MSLQSGEEPLATLTERLRAMLGEAADERASAEQQRKELAAERDAKIDAIRSEYAGRIATLDESLSMLKRVERALMTPEEKRALEGEKPTAEPAREVMTETAKRFRPNDKMLREILAAIESGHETVADITPVVECSRGSVEAGIPHLRDDGLIRLAGTVKVRGGNGSARAYRITPEGEQFLATNREPVTNGAHA